MKLTEGDGVVGDDAVDFHPLKFQHPLFMVHGPGQDLFPSALKFPH